MGSPVQSSNPERPLLPLGNPRIPFDLATPERVLGLPLVPQPCLSFFSSPLPKTASQSESGWPCLRSGRTTTKTARPRSTWSFTPPTSISPCRLTSQETTRPCQASRPTLRRSPRRSGSMEWGTCLEAMEAALELEKMVNQSLLELAKAADNKGDSHLSDFVDEFLEDQVASI